MRYDETMEELQHWYHWMKVFSFMFYGQPGVRDMEILEMGIKGALWDANGEILDKLGFLKESEYGDYSLHILVEEVNEEAARAYDVNRGWLIRFVFPSFGFGKLQYPIIEDEWWKEFLSDGLTELRVEHKFLFAEEIIGMRESNVQ